MISVTSFVGMLSPTLIHMSRTAQMRSISRERCRSWCEWQSKWTITYLIHIWSNIKVGSSLGMPPLPFISVYHLFWSTLYFLPLCSSKNPAFKEVLTRIEGHPDCRNLPMISFLILPMQRITRLPLLMDVSEIKLHSSTKCWIIKLWLLCNPLFIKVSTGCVLNAKMFLWPHIII